jgi:hypothetical protein
MLQLLLLLLLLLLRECKCGCASLPSISTALCAGREANQEVPMTAFA